VVAVFHGHRLADNGDGDDDSRRQRRGTSGGNDGDQGDNHDSHSRHGHGVLNATAMPNPSTRARCLPSTSREGQIRVTITT
jgi:hypothetical protein